MKRPNDKAIDNGKTQTDNSDETNLVALAVGGDRTAFGTIYLRHREAVYRHIYRMVFDKSTALELTSEAFYRAFRAIKRFRGESSFGTWLYAIATNVAIDHIRKDRRVEIPIESVAEIVDDASTPEERIDSRTIRDIIQKNLSNLSARERAVFVCRFVEERSVAETAEIMGVKEGTVKALYHRAIAKMAEKLRDFE